MWFERDALQDISQRVLVGRRFWQQRNRIGLSQQLQGCQGTRAIYDVRWHFHADACEFFLNHVSRGSRFGRQNPGVGLQRAQLETAIRKRGVVGSSNNAQVLRPKRLIGYRVVSSRAAKIAHGQIDTAV